MAGITFKRVWFFGGDKRDTTIDDFVNKYIASNGAEIECMYGWYQSHRWYVVDGEKSFGTLAEAKAYCAKKGA